MALQGTFVDIGSGSFDAAAASAGTVFATVVHSLGAAPDFVLPIYTSIGNVATIGTAQLVAYGGNASVSTIGLVQSGTGGGNDGMRSAPLAFNVLAWKLHSLVK